ncbi:MAG TPA: hypothetical protein VF979_09470 [Streptosporangiaceae bacterium]
MRSRPTSRNHAPDRYRARYRRLPRPGRITLAVAAGVAMTGGVVAVATEAVSAAQITRSGPAAANPRVTVPAPSPSPNASKQRVGQPARSAGNQPHLTKKPPTHSKPARAHTTALRTSCRSVAHIGDSTSVDLISPSFLPDPAQRLPARYTAVGVKKLKLDASGGRSIVETLPGQVNGDNVARTWWDQGYRGCWVFALGTNDSANIAVGSTMDQPARIDEMMATAHGEPVMWVNVRTTLTSGSWSSANEQAWDKALLIASHRYPNMRIFDWSAIAQPSWFLPDGVHYNSLGCQLRAAAIADALAKAFPLNGHSKGQVVK